MDFEALYLEGVEQACEELGLDKEASAHVIGGALPGWAGVAAAPALAEDGHGASTFGGTLAGKLLGGGLGMGAAAALSPSARRLFSHNVPSVTTANKGFRHLLGGAIAGDIAGGALGAHLGHKSSEGHKKKKR